jgi:hypothetical protein
VPQLRRNNKATDRKLKQGPNMKVQDHNIMKKHDHMEPVTSQQGSIYVTLHHTIQTSRKQLPLQDYSCHGGVKTNELSSDDIQHVGATVQQDLHSTVLYFRTHQVCFTADIATIYCQVSELQQDTDLQGIQRRHSMEEAIHECILQHTELLQLQSWYHTAWRN